ncbi:DUF2970 domain-containing protein [Porticoccus sp. W117]|uniref:DUF2970 domain-containing protein n=1 Tax=Porticoccus sp. W117 TaxID=3054777 RepID=UPI0025967861|nr:DUF2970 domain-containing protein [Porticoccus sp. W117]MDM3870020.1 DUF2970 domain-containing protein [Porticoccus sp. W117]
MKESQPSEQDKPTVKELIGSTLAAGIGVQSDKNRERDFKTGSFKTFLICGIVFTVVFIFGLIAIVRLVLP